MTIQITNDFHDSGSFKFLPEFEITFGTHPKELTKVKVIRLGLWTHSIWFESTKRGY